MFGLSIVSVLALFYITISILATLLVVAACVASGNTSQASDELFLRSKIEQRGLVAAPAMAMGGLSNVQPIASHRFLAGVETKEEVVQKSVEKPIEKPIEEQPIRT